MTARLLALLLLSGALAAAGSSASTPTAPAVVSAGAYGISVSVPGQPGAGAASASAPAGGGDRVRRRLRLSRGRRLGADRSAVVERLGAGLDAQAVTDVLAISLLNGEITADSVAGRAKASATGADANGSRVTNLVLLGQPVAATAERSRSRSPTGATW